MPPPEIRVSGRVAGREDEFDVSPKMFQAFAVVFLCRLYVNCFFVAGARCTRRAVPGRRLAVPGAGSVGPGAWVGGVYSLPR